MILISPCSSKECPPFLTELVSGLDAIQTGIVLVLGYLFAPFFLILPLMFSTVIASESFAGERERKTIEALLYTPATDTELFVGKVLAGLSAGRTDHPGQFCRILIVLNAAAYPVMGRHLVPAAQLVPARVVDVTCHIAAGHRCDRVDFSQGTNLYGCLPTSGSLVLVVLALLVGQATGVIYLSVLVGLLIGAVILAVGRGFRVLRGAYLQPRETAGDYQLIIVSRETPPR